MTCKGMRRLSNVLLLFLTLLSLMTADLCRAAEGVPAEAGQLCTFVDTVRYSELVINSRINDFKANTKQTGLGVFNRNGYCEQTPKNTASTLDYVPGLVAKAIIEAVDYYKDRHEVDVAPWFYAVQQYACTSEISSNGKNGKSFDDLNAVKVYFMLSQLAAQGCFAESPNYTNEATVAKSLQRMGEALEGIRKANSTYVIPESLLPEAAGGWWHKSSYTHQMWCDEMYMGPALLAQLICEYPNYASITDNDWDLVTRQFTIAWNFLWNDNARLLYHAFTADPAGSAASKWEGVSATPGAEVYHSAEYWGRAVAWYFLAMVDVLELMALDGKQTTDNYTDLRAKLNMLAVGVAARQDDASGCWYQLLQYDDSYIADSYNRSYSYTTSPVANYLESSCSAIFTAAYLKGMRLGLFDVDYTALAVKAYQGVVSHFMVSDGQGGVHLVYSCKSAGLGGSNYRDGSANYYLMGQDTQPTSITPPHFYTEGKVLGGFILAATEYERLQDQQQSSVAPVTGGQELPTAYYSLSGRQLQQAPRQGLYISRNHDTKKVLRGLQRTNF